jgi:hypothetical protein
MRLGNSFVSGAHILKDLKIVPEALDSQKPSDKESISAEPAEMLVKEVAA